VHHASGHGILVIAVEGFSEVWLSGEDDAEDQAAIHLEVGEDAQHTEHVRAQVVGFVQNEHWAPTRVREIRLELFL
jgi:hypothetical protein